MPATQLPPELLSTAQVAERYSISTKTIYRAAMAGDLRRVRIGSAVRFRADDLADWIERHTETAWV